MKLFLSYAGNTKSIMKDRLLVHLLFVPSGLLHSHHVEVAGGTGVSYDVLVAAKESNSRGQQAYLSSQSSSWAHRYTSPLYGLLRRWGSE